METELFHNILKEYWGYTSFRPLQEDIIQSVWEKRDTLGLMPTGGGKSLTFQVPVMAMDGICLVVTPLIALMKDQVDNLRERGIKAAAVYSGMSRDEIITTLENCIFGGYKFLYVSPERLSSDIFLTKLQAMDVCLLVVDESHCISQWGYDFRPSYLKIADIRETLINVPVLALTATATPDVVDDIQEKLRFKEKNVFRTSFLRDNLSYVVRSADNKVGELIHILKSVPGSGIVYVRSRRQTKEIAQTLKKEGLRADYFHAGLSYEDKIFKQNAWKDDECPVIVSTNAFGMGIDKPDVRIVVHMDLPNSPEEYFQEAGRAGRDGKKSYSVILYTKSDSVKLKKRISDTFPEKELIVRVYEALGNYFQVAVGSGAGRAFDFDLIEFCSRFKLPSLQTHHALKILELAGYLEYTDEIDARSKLRFLIYRDDMYSLRLEPITDELLHTIMRSYTGVFSDDIYIDESMLASRIGKTRQEVYDILVNLSKLRYISYVPAKKTPFIIYTSSREDIKFITIPQSVYEERKKRFSKRIHSIIDYAENSDVCRSRMLLVYFGETNSKDCGCCDVCLRKNESGLSNWEYRLIGEKLEEAFKSQTTYRLNELVDSISESETLAISSSETTSFSKQGENNDKIIKVIRFKIDSGELILEDDRISKGKRL
ncbi:MAG TPA: RecQ family ATP-dependent DNA helicase [Fermentimonas caenicola]|jgi:ATP-dependent DNA helicase RecQ|uniref:ATP-dependent DNA helicase RecQ n=1 Tax=Fermentimonas caenicola TaxID=1562970 RepID=A0A098BYU6_9BACT|nr:MULTISPECIES: RecQ family ATP-dependent DNA helicase [Lascolabacillus]MBP6176323.1 RecQ family ATP-dependent DNA helicase [Fermentimonas sp.]MDI9626058.1 RecQ family ATP-dependent DNA helicase [Bacteroidota bacterium]CEA14648.1 ATP-dependent DNA helicase RecQ [Fermentimonas caenicola]MDD3658097.1 RecQ family ATP-dependent DNA helicase [Lascolabacillus sp.]HHU40816.1 RecQ family ATP-dependent DNA helicase [Fermentimonas caenicola]